MHHPGEASTTPELLHDGGRLSFADQRGMFVLCNGGAKEQRAEEDQGKMFFFVLFSRRRIFIPPSVRGSLVVVEFDWLNGNRLWGVVRPIVAIWHNMMLESLIPLHAVLKQLLLLRPLMGTVGMVGICATWTLVSAMLLQPLGKPTLWGCSWAQSKIYDPGGGGRPGHATYG